MSLSQALEITVRLALEEDIGSGDVTTQYFGGAKGEIDARIITREICVLAGVDAAVETFRQVDSSLNVQVVQRDGAKLSPNTEVLKIHGSGASILTGERVALNFLQHLSGIATLTNMFVEAVQGTKARILDTRKTMPGLRFLQKAAVQAGGGVNHRMGLYDMVMVKDNHLAPGYTSAFLQQAIDTLKKEKPGIKVEFEADRIEQVQQFLNLRGLDRILLDNMSLAALSESVLLNAGRLELEASGGVSLSSVRGIAETGVDFISIGALTHSVPAVDLSMEFN
ncbi:MAG: carboxylating nicotinate-nucleotide diphosphorylase [Chthoniobacterales bacterium]